MKPQFLVANFLEVNVPIGFQPLLDGILLDLEPEAPLSTIIDVQQQYEKLCRWGRILAIGPEVRDAKVGQRVLASITAGVEMDFGILIRETALLAYAHE
jgi:hypothetical protein